MEFEATNNMEEYEALILGLHTAKIMNIECLTVYGDSELVIRQIRNQCQAKHPRLRTYRNEVWDLIENFFLAFNIQFLPREGNTMIDSLVVAANTFRPLKILSLDMRWKSCVDHPYLITSSTGKCSKMTSTRNDS